MNLRKAIHAAFLVICFVGLCVQLYKVWMQYFSFRTSTTSRQDDEGMMSSVTVDLCFQLNDLIDPIRVLADTGINVSIGSSNEPINLLTIAQLLNYTPSGDKLLRSCLYRDKEAFMEKTEDCYQIFFVDRHYTQQFICYSIIPVQMHQYASEQIASAQQYPFMMYEFMLGEAFHKTSFISPTLRYTTNDRTNVSFPYISRKYSPITLDKLNTTNGKREQNLLLVTNAIVEFYSLPFPYETKCKDIMDIEYYVCKKNCLIGKMRALDRVPSSVAYKEPLPVRVMTIADLKDTAIRNATEQIRKACEEQCLFTPCVTKYSVTSVATTKTFDPDAVYIGVMIPQWAKRVAVTIPVVHFIEFFSFTCGCFGIWFGMSFLSLDPSRWLEKKPPQRNRLCKNKYFIHHVILHSNPRNNMFSRRR